MRTAGPDSVSAGGEGGPGEAEWPGSVASLPGHLLRRCQQIAVGIFLDQCAHLDLTPLQFAVLTTLDEQGPKDQAALGRLIALDRTTAAVVIRKLEEKGLVRRAASPTDRRAKLVHLTDRGRQLAIEARGPVMAAQKRIVFPLSRREQEQLLRLLDTIARENNAFSRAPQRRP